MGPLARLNVDARAREVVSRLGEASSDDQPRQRWPGQHWPSTRSARAPRTNGPYKANAHAGTNGLKAASAPEHGPHAELSSAAGSQQRQAQARCERQPGADGCQVTPEIVNTHAADTTRGLHSVSTLEVSGQVRRGARSQGDIVLNAGQRGSDVLAMLAYQVHRLPLLPDAAGSFSERLTAALLASPEVAKALLDGWLEGRGSELDLDSLRVTPLEGDESAGAVEVRFEETAWAACRLETLRAPHRGRIPYRREGNTLLLEALPRDAFEDSDGGL